MNDYMKALHQRFFQEPEYPDIQRELDAIYQTLQGGLPPRGWDRLLDLEDLEFELREEVSLAAFTAGFRLASPGSWSHTTLKMRKRSGASAGWGRSNADLLHRKESERYGKTQAVRRRHGPKAGGRPLGRAHRHRPQD